jgi:HD-like signal output (HDOD) protein
VILERMKEIVDGIRTVRPWPPVARRVLELSRDPEVGPGDLVELLRTDGPLTARVLRLCNSAAQGFRVEVTSLQEAATRLGREALVQLVLASCVEDTLEDGSGSDARRAERWEEALQLALSAHFLAVRQGSVDPELAYTAGLLAHFGYLVLDPHLADCARELETLRAEGASESEAEREVLGLDHARVGARMMRRWEFPELLVDAVEHHHDPRRSSGDPALCSIVHLAERVAVAIGRGEDLTDVAEPTCRAALELTGLDPSALKGYEVALQLELERARELSRAAR